MTQVELARVGKTTPEMRQVAEREGVGVEVIREGLLRGTIVIPANPRHQRLNPCGIGKGLRTKVNANIGTSSDFGAVATELEKLSLLTQAGADTAMDLSTGDNLVEVRRAILEATSLPLGTVPIYQAAVEAISQRGSIVEMSEEDLFSVIEAQAVEGVDFTTIHCGITLAALEHLKNEGRVTDVVSRGGAFIVGWMLHRQEENPLYHSFDRLLEIARAYDVTLSLGDGLRPGSLADATDRAQVAELITLGELVDRAREAGVQVMVEGPGHVPLHHIEANIQLQKRLCREAPFYVLGPLVTDVAAGYDHITAAIGGAVAAAAGADFLCYVTPAEHLGLPDAQDVRLGVIASRIAAHAADIVKGVKGAWDWDVKMSQARKALDWEEQARLSLDPERAKAVHSRRPATGKACTMCGAYCAMDLVAQFLGRPAAERC